MTTAKMAQKARLDRLREEIANGIACEKAYNVPAFCVRLGLLAEATEEDKTLAFNSKRSYVKPMLANKDEPDLLSLAEKVLEEVDYAGLEVLVTEMTKHATHRVSSLVRKDVLITLNGVDQLFGDQQKLEAIERIFGSQAVQSEQLSAFLGARHAGPITRHYIRNEDWTHQQMLEHCGALECPQATFFRLIEEILHPMVRRDVEQRDLAEAISQCLRKDGFAVKATSVESGYPIFEVVRATPGVQGQVKNLIFASVGEKPELVIKDAVNNDVEIVKNADKVLIFDRALPTSRMLSWAHLQSWWAELNGIADKKAAKAGLYRRLAESVKLANSPGEQAIFRTYFEHFGRRPFDKLPALIPQVYLHYDPYTKRERGQEQVLARQRMDFLMLLDNGVRVVIEVDGQHHYGTPSESGRYQASPGKYASMAAEDRRLRLSGYEVYRFGGYEFKDYSPDGEGVDLETKRVIVEFFNGLFIRHGLPPVP